MSVGLVHDYLLVERGAERTFAAIASCWPQSTIHTTLASPEIANGLFAGREIRTSGLQRLRIGQRSFRWFLPLLPRAVEGLHVDGDDLVVSSSSAFAHGVRASPSAVHVCYCHAPFRYAWHERELALSEAPRPLRPLLARILDGIRRWDRAAAERVTSYIANSRITQRRIREAYGRDSTVIHPPVDVERFERGDPQDYFLVVGEFVPHKRIELALQAARLARARLIVVGGGPQHRELSTVYSDVAEFPGRVDDRRLASLYSEALAVIVPSIEEFGIVAVEAQASGCPVVAPAIGGASETVRDGLTGVLLDAMTPDNLAVVLSEIDFTGFAREALQKHAAQFSTAAFKKRLREEVGSVIAGRKTASSRS